MGELSKKIFSAANIYTAVSLLYLIRSELLPTGSKIKWILWGAFFSLSVYYFIQVIAKYKLNPFAKVLSFIMGMVIIYGTLFAIVGVDSSWIRKADPLYFLTIYFESLLPIYAFYYFSKNGMIDEKWFKIVGVLFFVAAIFLYYSNLFDLHLDYGEDAEITNNIGYYIVSLIPVLVFYKKRPVLQFVGLAIVAILVLNSFKRGAIVITCMSAVLFFWRALKQPGKTKWWILALIIIVSVFIAKYVGNLLSESLYFNARIESTLEGDASNRDIIYSRYLNYFFDSNPLFFIFGHGAFGTCHYLGLMAHNDWLEFMIDMGLIGLIAYLVYWIRYYKMYRTSLYYNNNCISDILLLFGVIYFLKSFFSMSIMGIPFFASSVLGYAIGRFDFQQEYGTNS